MTCFCVGLCKGVVFANSLDCFQESSEVKRHALAKQTTRHHSRRVEPHRRLGNRVNHKPARVKCFNVYI